MKKEYKYHYVYRITNKVTGYHYYGSKSCNEEPKENIGKKYFSNSSVKLFIQDQKNNPQDYKYKVIKIFETKREDATELEVILHRKFDVKNHPLFINKSNQTSKRFDTTGQITVRHKVTGETKNIEQGDIPDGYEFITKGKLTVFDEMTNTHKLVTIEEYNKNNNYISTTFNKVNVIKNGTIVKVSKEEYYSDDSLKSNLYGTVPVVDKRDGSRKRVSKEDFNNFEYYESTRFVRVEFYNSKGEFQFVNDYQIDDFLKDRNMPLHAFKVSYKNNGERVYHSLKESPRKVDIINKGWYKFKDWYAIKIN